MDILEELPPPGMRLATLEDQFYCGQLLYAAWEKFVPIDPPTGQLSVDNRTYAYGMHWVCSCIGHNQQDIINNWCPLCNSGRPEGLVDDGPVTFSN